MDSGRRLQGILLGIFSLRFFCSMRVRQEEGMLRTSFTPVRLIPLHMSAGHPLEAESKSR
jgi:hypothetical protein